MGVWSRWNGSKPSTQIFGRDGGFEQGTNVIVLAATNRSEVLDFLPYLRPGRFDRRVNIDLPDRKDREAILKIHFTKKPMAKDVDLDSLAAKLPGSPGQIYQTWLMKRPSSPPATILIKLAKPMYRSFEKVCHWSERRARYERKRKRADSLHEAGHAIGRPCLPDSDVVHIKLLNIRSPRILAA